MEFGEFKSFFELRIKIICADEAPLRLFALSVRFNTTDKSVHHRGCASS